MTRFRAHQDPSGASRARLFLELLKGTTEQQRHGEFGTQYFLVMRTRPDRLGILEEWIQRAATAPCGSSSRPMAVFGRWASIPEREGRYLRVVPLADGETVHNALFDPGFHS